MLGDVVREAARRFGESPAIVAADGDVLTYADLDLQSDEVAAGMLGRGVREGDVVALTMNSGPSYIVAYAAAAKVGAVTAGINERLSVPEKESCLTVADPVLEIADDDQLQQLRSKGGTAPELPQDPDRPVAIVFTSGTTGLPKGAVYGNRQLDAISEVDGGRRFGGGGRGLGGTSMAHIGTMTKLPQNLRGGGTTFLIGRWSAGEALEMVERHRITSMGGIPTQFALMLRHQSFDSTDLTSVKILVFGGGPAAPSLIREARERFGVPVVTRYSCTEAGVGTGTKPGDPDEEVAETVGRARAGIEITIRVPLDSDARETVGVAEQMLPVGEVGEVCISSEAVMSGYYRDPVSTAAVMTADGAVRTGDLGWLDGEGRLRLAGRSKEMYVRGGYNVFPLEIEVVLLEHPDVAEIAIVPRTDAVMGEIGVAVVVPKDPHRPPALADLRQHAEGRLAHHKLPEDVMVVQEIPRTAMEKVDRKRLKEAVANLNPG